MNSYPNELAHFAKDSDTWWDVNGPFKPLHQINPIRLAYIQQHVSLANARVVDIGCGGGLLTEAMAKAGAQVTGIDLVDACLITAKTHAAHSGLDIDYQCISAETFAEQLQTPVDVVTCLELLEHVPEPKSILDAAARMTKPGGKVICSTLNRHPKAFLFGIIGAEYILGLVPKGTHHYRQFIKPSELSHMASTVGLQAIDVQGLAYDPFQGQARLCQDLSINYLMCFERL